MKYTRQDLINAGLPIDQVFDDAEGRTQASFLIPLTPAQLEIFDEIVEPTKKAKRLRKNASVLSLAPLVGRNISSINNNADREMLNQAVYFMLGICDENGIILSATVEQMK